MCVYLSAAFPPCCVSSRSLNVCTPTGTLPTAPGQTPDSGGKDTLPAKESEEEEEEEEEDKEEDEDEAMCPY